MRSAPPPSTHPVEDAASLRALYRELRAAPRNVRLALWMTVAGVGIAILIAVLDVARGTDRHEVFRLAGLVASALGCGILALAQVLNQLAQGVRCDMWRLPDVRFAVLHRNVAMTPLLCTLSAVLMALAIGLMAISVPDSPVYLLPILLVLLYLVLAVRTIQGSSGFLYRHAREQAEAAALAQAQATQAQLSALQAQMNPHFLFNALNTVAALVRTHDPAAETTVEDLAEVLRRTLDRSRSMAGTVAEEMDYLRAYLAIEQQRFGERLRVSWRVDPDSLDVTLPPLTVQPLVENAIKHGIGGRLEGGELAISVVRANGDLFLSVADNGVGFPARYREGTGLGNLRQRLQTLFGESSELDVQSGYAGSCVTIKVPVENGRPDAHSDRRR